MYLENYDFDYRELRAELARRRWTRARLAKAAGLSESYIKSICAGATPATKSMQAILDALGEGGERILRKAKR